MGDLIDWYNVQWYNQMTTTYDTCDTLFVKANGWSTHTAVLEVAAAVPLRKLVLGKPVKPADAANTGYMDVAALAQCLRTAVTTYGWNAGVMGWQYKSDVVGSQSTWINVLAPAFS